MIITPLGHTEFLVDIAGTDEKNVRIMVDGWFSNYALGDLMERTVKVDFDDEGLRSVDALYISHAHCDHFDPYSLMRIYSSAQPLLLLPETLIYLRPLLEEYIPGIQIQFLRNKELFRFHGVEITATAFEQDYVTNEDDVMTLAIANDYEILFAEIDTAPPDTIEAQKYLYKLFTKREYTTVAYIASRNELEGNLKILDFSTEAEREKFRTAYLHERKEEIEWGYAKWEYENYEDMPNIMTIPGFVRGFIGQGICYPTTFSSALAGLACFTLDEVVDKELNLGKTYGFDFPQKVLTPGRQYRLENGTIETGRKECPIGKLTLLTGRTALSCPEIRKYAQSALSLDIRDFNAQKLKIEKLLDTIFLPYWFASSIANLRNAILSHADRAYRLQFIGQSNENCIYEFTFADSGFREVTYLEGMRIDESYFMNDIDDFLEGKQELYSNFWHKLDPKKQYRLWTLLGANFLHHALVEKKYRLHFERAKAGETVDGFFQEFVSSI